MQNRIKKFLNFSFTLLIFLSFWSCKDNSTGFDEDDKAPQQRIFIWDAMNYWYYWQKDVPQLADEMAYFDGEEEYHRYLNSFPDPEDLFHGLLFSEDNFKETGEDDFSFFIDNYEDFQEQQQGISKSFGMEYGLLLSQNGTDIEYGYIQYVVPNAPAERAGVVRGDVFTKVNGTSLTINNYSSVLSAETYDLSLAEFDDNGNLTETGEVKSITRETVDEDPVYLAKIINAGSSKVGYLVYNSFQRNSHEHLNNVFGDFVSEGIDELVLDLRYNSGGAVVTSRVLCSMISGLGSSDVFGEYSFNSKRAPQWNDIINFYTSVPLYEDDNSEPTLIDKNSVSINRLFVLTDYKTASASESVINTLRAYMDVIVIGTQTVGKDDISVTLYDSGVSTWFLDSDNANPKHNIALQPIVGKLVNKDGNSENDGFIPDIQISELWYLDDLAPLGDVNEPLLATALQQITGGPVAKSLKAPLRIDGGMFRTKIDRQKASRGMYLFPDEMENMKLNQISSN